LRVDITTSSSDWVKAVPATMATVGDAVFGGGAVRVDEEEVAHAAAVRRRAIAVWRMTSS
jgi:hypothetical protein